MRDSDLPNHALSPAGTPSHEFRPPEMDTGIVSVRVIQLPRRRPVMEAVLVDFDEATFTVLSPADCRKLANKLFELARSIDGVGR